MDGVAGTFAGAESAWLEVYIGVFRYLAPGLALVLLLRCLWPLLTFRREPEIWAWLCLEDGRRLPVTHWENVIGRHKRSDLVIDFPTVSRSHAVLTRYDDGSWTVRDTDSKGGVLVNGEGVTICALSPEDVICIGGVNMTLQPISRKQEKRLAQLRTKASGVPDSFANLMLLTVFQLLTAIAFLLQGGEHAGGVALGFGGIVVCQWLLLTFYVLIRRTAFELETVAFFLCTMGMAAIATYRPQEAGKQLIALVLGILVFLAVGWSLRDLERAKIFRRLAAVAGIGLLVFTLVFGTEQDGAKNWILIGPLSLQPSELSKVCFVYAGASAMDRILTRRNIIGFIVYSVLLCGCLALMNDFGTALIFFCAFLVVAYLRSGSVGTIGLACTSLGFAGAMAVRFAPHALRRFSTWRHIWEDPQVTGYQQTRGLICVASGGLLGLGPGQGWSRPGPGGLPAGDSDSVVATLGEEWGLVMLVAMIVCILAMGLFSVRSASVARSSFYTIGACTAAGIFLVQTMLNALGALDILPFTGVNFPFVSNGGSSMMATWGLLAFIKAADTRQNASFAVPLLRRRRGADE